MASFTNYNGVFNLIEDGNHEKIRTLLEEDDDVPTQVDSLRNSDGLAPVHSAVIKGDTEVVKSIIRAGCTVLVTDSARGWYPVHYCVQNNNATMLELLIKEGAATVTCRARRGAPLSPLQLAVALGHHDCARVLLEAGARVNATDGKVCCGETVLFEAVRQGDVEMVELLCRFKADHTLYDKDGLSVLGLIAHLPLRTGEPILKVLQARGYHVNHRLGLERRTILHYAAACAREDLVAHVLGMGASLQPVDSDGLNALHLSILRRDAASFDLLLRAGSSVEEPQLNSMLTPLHLACLIVFPHAVMALLRHGAPVNPVSARGQMPIEVAVQFSEDFATYRSGIGAETEEIVRALIEHRALVYRENMVLLKSFICGGFANKSYAENSLRVLHMLVAAGASWFDKPVLERVFPMIFMLLRDEYPFKPAAVFMIENGLHFPVEPQWLASLQETTPSTREWVMKKLQNPVSLQQLARKAMRDRLFRINGGKEIYTVIKQLVLPRRMIDFLLLIPDFENALLCS